MINKYIEWLEENIWWPIERVIDKPQKWYREVKWFIQRGKRGYADCDLWGWDYYMARTNIKALKQFKEKLYGHPFGFNDIDEWKDTIQQMIDGFQASIDIDDVHIIENGAYNHKKTVEEIERLEKIRLKGMRLFTKWYQNLWD
jgi:hypothetical protein